MMSSFGDWRGAQLGEEIGFAACLTKPVRDRELFNALISMLSPADAPRKPASTPSDLSSMFAGIDASVLLVEDNAIGQRVALGILKKLGLRADAVANGQEAIDVLATTTYDVVLMDTRMPVMDGLEAARLIRSPQSSVLDHHVTIIAMTANAMRGDQEACLEAGMDDYLAKPVTPLAMAGKLRKWLAPGAFADLEYEASREDVAKGETPVFDMEAMLDRMMGDKDLMVTIMKGFLSSMPEQMHALRKAIESGDATNVEFHAHLVKGAAGNIGGKRLMDVATQMEVAAKAKDMAAMKAMELELHVQFDQLAKAIRETETPQKR